MNGMAPSVEVTDCVTPPGQERKNRLEPNGRRSRPNGRGFESSGALQAYRIFFSRHIELLVIKPPLTLT